MDTILRIWDFCKMHKKYFLASAIIWMLIIFSASSQPAVKQDVKPFISHYITQPELAKILPKFQFNYANYTVSSDRPYEAVEFFIRKAAHVTEYFILSVLWHGAINPVTFSEAIPAVTLSIMFAGSDEWHQTFVPGRTGHVHDVLVDSCGILLGMAAYLMYKKSRHNNF